MLQRNMLQHAYICVLILMLYVCPQVSHVLNLREGAGAATSCNASVALWEEATRTALAGAFGERREHPFCVC